jgi:uncharacterized membrane protein YjfL (UPF0719 family)
MWKLFGNIVEMFIYASVYMIISLIALKITAAAFMPDLEKKLSENNTAFSLLCASVFIGMALILSSVLR